MIQMRPLSYTLPELHLGPVKIGGFGEFFENAQHEIDVLCLVSIDMIFYSEP